MINNLGNNDLGIYKDTIPNHGKGKDPGTTRNYNKVNYSYDNVLGYIQGSHA